MSYNVSYADEDIASHAEGDTAQATKYGDVFVEHYATDLMQVECQGTQCFVACSCNTSNGWYDTPAGAKGDDTNAQVYSIKSKRHRSVSSALSLGTSSINDATADALTIGTSSMKNQTPIKASTRSDLAIDAPTIQTASASADKLTCYKKIPCDVDAGYYSTENECRKGSQSYYYALCRLDNSSGCYVQTTCDASSGYYPVSSNPIVTLSDTYTELTNGSGTECHTVTGCNEDNEYYESSSSVDTEIFTRSSTTQLGQTCYYASGCAEGYCKNSAPAYFSGTTVGTTQDGTKCIKVDDCSTPDLPYWLVYDLEAPSCGLVDGAELKCPIATGCDNDYGYYDYKSEFTCDTGYVTVPTEWGFSCYRCDACSDGYFAIDPDDYQRIEFSDETETLANGTTECYKPIGCKDDLADTTRCYTVTLSKDTEMLGDVTCTSSIQEMCDPSTYYHYYKENPTGSKVDDAIAFDTETINGSTCYKATSCEDGYTETETDGDCYIYGDVTCYEKEECPDGYYEDRTLDEIAAFIFDTKTVGSKTCYKATSCDNKNDYYDECVSKIELVSQSDLNISTTAIGDLIQIGNCPTVTWHDELTCYYRETNECPDGYDFYKSYPNYMNYKTTDPTSGSGTCYRATSCKSGYTYTSGTCYTDNDQKCCAKDGWPTDVYFSIDCTSLPLYHSGIDCLDCQTEVLCKLNAYLGSSSQSFIDLGDYTFTDSFTYRLDLQTYGSNTLGHDVTFPIATSSNPNNVSTYQFCCYCGSGIGGNEVTRPCSRVQLHALQIWKGVNQVYYGTGGNTIELTVTSGSTTRTDNYNVNVIFNVPTGW